ncbi:MAG: 4Fe-4S binding protein, partial [Nitrospinota bacterium]|nr:4Fe-4S binding protein [Nitrospinota bacterium]
PFRSKTLTGPTAWKWRHVKWIFFALYVAAAYAIFNWAPNSWTSTFLGLFTLLVVIPYFATFFLTPITGNRFYCRYMCPYGATFGLLNKVGFFRIDFNKETCTDCDLCEMVCDMGIPVVTIGRAEGKVDTTECMGCGRCVTECPSRSLAFHDIRNIAFPALRQDGRVLKESSGMASPVLRRHAALFTLMMVAVALLAGWFFTALGSAAELSSNLVGLVCGH